MNPEILEKVLACRNLPSLPAVALRVIELTQDNSVRTAELAATITNDQGLSAKLLRTVNSSFYALRKPCTTIQGAIIMLGFNAVKTLALGFSLVSSMAENRDQGFDYQSYWRRALLSGVSAKCFARTMGLKAEEECFLGGLLQDIGMVALYRALGAEYHDLIERAQDHRLLVKFELAELELSHCDVGSLLASRWKLPPALALPIKYHERPSAAPLEVLDVCKAVGLGNLAADLLTTSEPGPVLKRLYTKAEELGGLTNTQVDEIMKAVQHGAREVARLLSLDIGQVEGMGTIMERANAQLAAVTLPFSEPAAGENADARTGLATRLTFNRNAVSAFSKAAGGAGVMTIALAQLDDLDDIAETHGRHYADDLCCRIARMLAAHFANGAALVCAFDETRLGLILAGCDRAEAARMIDECRVLVGSAAIACAPPDCGVIEIFASMSIGACTLDALTQMRVTTPDEMIELTERALAAAQRAGGGCLRAFSPRAAAA
ncbi:hypothetical protein BH11PLA1_BH11PLA1_05570 [soil metagenome]